MKIRKYVAEIIVLGLLILIPLTVRQAEAGVQTPQPNEEQTTSSETVSAQAIVVETGTVDAGNGPSAVAVNPETNKIYVANGDESSVTVIDGNTFSTTSVSVGDFPFAVAVNPVTDKIYVANQGGLGAGNGSITVINGADNSATTIGGSLEPTPWDVAVNPATNKIYVADIRNDQVIVIDGKNNSLNTVPVGFFPVDIAINQLTNRIYVANFGEGSGSLSIIDGATDTVIATRFPGNNPQAVVVNPLTNKVYVANVNGNDVAIMNGADNSFITTLSVGTFPSAAAINTQTNKIYIGNDGSNSVTVIGGATDTVETTISASTGYPMQIAVNETTNQIFVTDSYRYVTLIDGTDNITTPIETGGEPAGVAVDPLTDVAYVTNPDRDNVTLISPVDQGNTDVGVIPGPNGCSKDVETIWIKMDDEHDGNSNSQSGWVGAIAQNKDTNFYFCRVNGEEFKHWAADNDSYPEGAYGYAVLKLGTTCPNGSKEFSRYFDNQNSRRFTNLGGVHVIHNENEWRGKIDPNTAYKDTTLYFCFFEGRVGSSNETMDRFPEFPFEYGVFANAEFLGALETGNLFIDDEDDPPANRHNFLPGISSAQQQSIYIIIGGRFDSFVNLAQVHDPQDDQDFTKCPDHGYCQDNPRPINLDISIYKSVPLTDRGTYEEILKYFGNAIYEMTEGFHIIRKITVHQNNRSNRSANVYWIAREHPKADVSGYHPRADVSGYERGQVFFGDVFPDGGGPSVDIDFLDPNRAKHAGYTFAHEWGHYYYGLPDEYAPTSVSTDTQKLCDKKDKIHFGSPCPDDDEAEPSVMNNQWQAYEIITKTNHYEWLNFSVAKTNKGNNAQHRVYGVSGWETLARDVTEDPRADSLSTSGPPRQFRVFFPEFDPELDPFGFVEDSLPSIQLDTQSAPPINVKWDEEESGNLSLIAADGTAESGSSPYQESVPIDSSPKEAEFNISYDGTTDSGNVTLIVRDPNGNIANLVNCPASGYTEITCSLKIIQPENGTWTLEVEIEKPPLIIDHYVTVTYPEEIGPIYHASVASVFGEVISYPTPVLLTAQVAKDLPITNVNLNAEARGPDGVLIPLSLKDDGVPPDKIANDGEYVGFLPYDQNGAYRVTVTFDNQNGTAEFTSAGLSHPQPSYPVGENFQRADSTVVTIVDYAADDHGSTPDDATPLDPDNSDQPGQIDSPNDCDLFSVVPTETGQLVVRIVGLALGMEPHVQILDEDGVTVLKEMSFDPALEDYMFVGLDVVAGKPFYVRVCHLDPNADSGFYYISVGPPLVNEEDSIKPEPTPDPDPSATPTSTPDPDPSATPTPDPSAPPAPSPEGQIYLPIIVK